MRREPIFVVFLMFVLALSGRSQLRVSGQASAAFLKANNGYSQYSINSGLGTFAWRLDLFGDAVVADNIFFSANFRMLQDQVPHIDLLSLRMTDLASAGINVEAGEIELPFGNLGGRRFPKSNPFFSLPLTREHLTTLRSSNYSLWPYDERFTIAGNGVRLLDQGLYDLGVKVSGNVGIFDYGLALINGMVSATSTYSSSYTSTGLNNNGGFGKIFRLAATPVTGLTIGASYAAGPFIRDFTYTTPEGSYNPGEYQQKIVEGDIDFGIDHLTFYGEAFYNIWQFAQLYGSDLKAFGYSLEGKFTPVPRVSIAARAGGLVFNDVLLDLGSGSYGSYLYSGKWDRDVFRLEGALGYRIDRAVLLKLVYQWNRTFGTGGDPVDNVFAVQSVLSF